MRTIKRIFMVVEAGHKNSSISNLEFANNEAVEVVDLTTRCRNHIKACEVSIYRHFLQFHGKSFNILGVREGFC